MFCYCLVDSEEILNLNPDFIQGLFDNREPSTAEVFTTVGLFNNREPSTAEVFTTVGLRN